MTTTNLTKTNEDFEWFIENYSKFQKEYGNAFIVIKDKNVLGVYSSYAEGVRITSQTEELGTFIVQECASTYEAYQCSIASLNFK